MEQQKIKKAKVLTEEQKEKHREYVRAYNKRQPTLNCNVCGGRYQSLNKHHHLKTNKHLDAVKRGMNKDDNYYMIKELQNKIEGLEQIISTFKTEDPDYENEVFENEQEEQEEITDEEFLEDWDINSVVASEIGKWTDSELNYII